MQFPTATVLAIVLASLRASAWLVMAQPFSNRAIPAPVKALLSLAIALPAAPRFAADVGGMDTGEILISAIEQVTVGAALGFLSGLVFAAVRAAGDLIDLFGGFSLAFAFDPHSATGGSVFGKFYHLIAITLLFASGGHLLMLRGFTHSYQTLPLTDTLSLGTLNTLLTGGLTQMFVSALQIAGPLIAVMFCADVALGLLVRVAPALNAFALGFPAKILLTLVLSGAAMALLPRAVSGLVDRAVEGVVGGASG